MSLNIQPHRFDRVYLRTGKRHHSLLYLLGTDLRPRNVTGTPLGMILNWTKGLKFFALRAKHGRPPTAAFAPGPEGVRQVFAACQYTGQIDPSYIQSNHFLAAVVALNTELQLEVEFDTDHRDFRERQQQLGMGEPMRLEVGVVLFNRTQFDMGKLELVLEPVTEPQRYQGYAALDLGNTSTTLVALPAELHQVDDVGVLLADVQPGRLEKASRPVETKLRIDGIDTRFAVDTDEGNHPSWADWLIGVDAVGSDGLVLGAKRLVASQQLERPYVVYASKRVPGQPHTREPLSIHRRLPAELFVTRVFQRFREATYEEPDQLAITYPTTFSSQELAQLRDAVYRGWLRMKLKLQTPGELGAWAERMLLLLDEASAAAFFFIYRKLKQPGGVPRLRYLYPHGLNLLLYDCGGGTTDIALVSARPDEASDKLLVTVRARSGLRGFGGDNITTDVFRLLKAKMAMKLAEVRRQQGGAIPVKLPSEARQIADFLKQNADQFDRLIPTRFNPNVHDAISNRNRAHTLQLWALAEQMKVKLQNKPEAAVEVHSLAETPLLNFLTPPEGPNQPSRAQLANQIAQALGQVTINRREVDALIGDQVDLSVENCNRLISQHLTEKGEEIHWVVAAGNASCYPLIKEKFSAKLDVPFFDARFEMDPANLKLAVAKGAVLALATKERFGDLIQFPSDLCNRLPFDVAFYDFKANAYRLLFQEHTLYKDLGQQTVKLHPPGVNVDGSPKKITMVVLHRRWPGDRDFTPYLKFSFENGVQGGAITVSYDADASPPQFVVKDAENTPGLLLPEEEESSLSPVQRGNL